MTVTQTQTRIQLPGPQTLGNKRVLLQNNHAWEETARGSESVKNYHNVRQAGLRYLAKDTGLFRFGQLMDRGPRFVNAVRGQLGLAPSGALSILQGKGLTSWTWLTTSQTRHWLSRPIKAI